MTHPLLLYCLSEKPIWYIMWLYVTSRGYMPQSVVIRLVVLLMRQRFTRKNPGVHDRGYTSHIVAMRGYILHVYRKGPRTT